MISVLAPCYLDKNRMADQSTGGGKVRIPPKVKNTLKTSEFLGSDKCIFALDAFVFFLFDVITITSEVVTSHFDRPRAKNYIDREAIPGPQAR